MGEFLVSKVNLVERLNVEGHACIVKKTYFDRAIATGIRVPLKRAMIERKVAVELVRKIGIKNRGIFVRAPISYTPRTNIFPYVEGCSLRSLPSSEWPKPKYFQELGRFVAMIEATISPKIFSGLQVHSRKLGQIIRLYKTGFIANFSRAHFSLGDLNLGNILVSSNVLILIDFEFAHQSSAGFDIGMLVAEIDYRSESQVGRRCARQALLRGYNGAGGDIANVMLWRNRLAGHQARSRRKKNRGE